MDFVSLEYPKGSASDKSQTEYELSLKKGYLEMSRINQSLSEEGLACDNEALLLSEQKLTECEE